MPASKSRPLCFIRTLYFRVIVGILAGILTGIFFPRAAESLKPLSDGFIQLVRMLIAPVIFFTVVVGIAGIGDLAKLGRVGLKAILYFEAVTTLALAIGFTAAKVIQLGKGCSVAAP